MAPLGETHCIEDFYSKITRTATLFLKKCLFMSFWRLIVGDSISFKGYLLVDDLFLASVRLSKSSMKSKKSYSPRYF